MRPHTTGHRALPRLLLSLAALGILAGGSLPGRGATTPNTKSIRSGRRVGQKVPSFYVRAVTGPLRNKSVCYVCRNGSRPCVMVLFRKLEPGLTPLLKEIDRQVDRNRASGLKGFGVLISPQPSRAISKLQTLSFDNKIGLPLTVGTDAVSAPSCQNVHPEATVTVVLYHRQRVIQTYAFRSGQLSPASTKAILAGVRRLLDKS